MNYWLRNKLQYVYFTALAIILLGCGTKDKKFKLLDASQTGIDFSNDLNETVDMNIITYPDFYSGGGVSVGDINNVRIF